MSENTSKAQSFLLSLGVAFAVTSSLPLSSLTADAATAPDRLSALRAAADSGALKLLSGDASSPVRLAETDGFDNRAPVDTPSSPSPPNSPSMPEPGQ